MITKRDPLKAIFNKNVSKTVKLKALPDIYSSGENFF